MKWWVVLLVAIAAYAVGRFAGPESETLKREHEKILAENHELKKRVDESLDRVKNLERNKTTTIVELPGGKRITRIRDLSKASASSSSRKSESTESKTEIALEEKTSEEKTVINRTDSVTISALAGVPITEIEKGVVYGAMVSKKFIGPFNLGVWGFSDLRLGISIGINL